MVSEEKQEEPGEFKEGVYYVDGNWFNGFLFEKTGREFGVGVDCCRIVEYDVIHYVNGLVVKRYTERRTEKVED